MEKLIQITAGNGPEECEYVVAQVLRLLMQEAKQQGIHTEVIHREPGSINGTVKSAFVALEGEGVSAFLKSWVGTVQWVGKSMFRQFHKRKNWFVGVEEVEQGSGDVLKEEDIQYTAMRSGGPGGQHVNKVSTAIRAVHAPSGLMVVASDSRSQAQNKKKAKLRLEQAYQQLMRNESKEAAKEAWKQHAALERGNPVRVLQGTDFKSKHVDKSYKKKRQEHKRVDRNRLDE